MIVSGAIHARYLQDGKFHLMDNIAPILPVSIQAYIWGVILDIGYDYITIDFLQGYIAVFDGHCFSYKQIRDALYRLRVINYPIEHIKYGQYIIFK